MNKLFEQMESRQLYAAAAAVNIGGTSYIASADGGFSMLVPAKPVFVTPSISTPGINPHTQPSPGAAGFQIAVNLSGSGVTDAVSAAFAAAAERWERIITSDLPDVGGIDDLQINATVDAVDGPGGFLGQAGPRTFRAQTYLPITGIIQLDSGDVPGLAERGQLTDVIFHEMGRVLGIGTTWAYLKLKSGTPGDPRYTGAMGIAAYHALGGTQATVPLEVSGGASAAGSNWRENVFGNEIMTGFLNPGENLLSTMTIASLIDLGYGVDLSQADAYQIPAMYATGPLPDLSGSISGRIFADANNSGTLDDGEQALASKLVFLDANNNGKFDAGERFTVSDSDGSYAFYNLAAGGYRVRFAPAPGFVLSGAAGGTGVISLTAGETNDAADIGTFDGRCSITGTVYADIDDDGTRATGEMAAVKASVFLDSNNNGVLDRGEKYTLTANDGSYTFASVNPGTYNVRISLSSGVLQTGGGALSLPAGTHATNVMVGAYDTKGTISGTLYSDANNNVTQDAGEAPYARTVVYLDANANGVLNKGERFVTTAVDGSFSFTAVLPRDYTLGAVLPNGATLSTTLSPSLAPADHITDLAAGVFDTRVSVSGTAFADNNNNGQRDSGEPALAKAAVYLDTNADGRFNKGEPSAVTLGDGSFLFQNVLPGTYSLRVSTATGTVQTSATTALTLVASQHETGISVGTFNTFGRISGTVYNDANQNGHRDVGEAVSAGRVVFIDANNNALLDRSERFAITNSNGAYTLTNVAAGTYSLRVVLPPGLVTTTPASNAAVSVTLAAGGSLVDRSFGTYDTNGTIVGSSILDVNGNGQRDQGEGALGGVTIFMDFNGNGRLDPGERTTKTSAAGAFAFNLIAAGVYLIRAIAPLHTLLALGDDGGDSAVTVSPGHTTALAPFVFSSTAIH